MAVRVGELIADRYELEQLVGEGGMSSVYRAHDTVLERRVAIKVLHEHYSSDPEYVERFRREARAIARLAHPNVVTVIDRGEWDGRQFIVFEHVAGENLKAEIERAGALPVRRAVVLSIQIARALAYAHELEIVHRDVKPHNVLLDPAGTAKVTDFGIARTLDVEEALTQTGTVLGTGQYLSPEQANGGRGDERSDQYSLGVVIFELLTGEVPYTGGSLMAIAMKHVNDPVPSVRERRPEVPARLDSVVACAMAKSPEDRFPSMQAMVSALEACLAEAPGYRAPARPGGATPGRWHRLRHPRRARRLACRRCPPAQTAHEAGRRAAQVLGCWWLYSASPGSSRSACSRSRRLRTTVSAVSSTAAGAAARRASSSRRSPTSTPSATTARSIPNWSSSRRTETVRPPGRPRPTTASTRTGSGSCSTQASPVELSAAHGRHRHAGLHRDDPRRETGRTGTSVDVSESQEVQGAPRSRSTRAADAFRYYVVWITALESAAHVNEVARLPRRSSSEAPRAGRGARGRARPAGRGAAGTAMPEASKSFA